MNQSIVDEGGDFSDMIAAESQLSERPKKPAASDVRKFAGHLHSSSVTLLRLEKRSEPKIDHQTKSTIKDDVLIHGNDAEAEKPSTIHSLEKNGYPK